MGNCMKATAAAVIAPLEPQTAFDIEVQVVAGDSFALHQLYPNYTLQELRSRAAKSLGVPRGIVRLAHGTRVFDPSCYPKSLKSLDIGPCVSLVLVKQRVFEVARGMRIEVVGAGTKSANGFYTCVDQEEKLLRSAPKGAVSEVYFKKDGGNEAIGWFRAADKWPAAWYIQSENFKHGIYYLPSEEPTVLPLDCWQSYNAETWSTPGMEPIPSIDLAAVDAT